ncbi:hypothetical protein U0035_03030 [Niabella yanshanensis]|uniref:CARDB domain-containing protein n=1 Tax=Niabella yanshanensis TaxID=577386 RepID=A0ABZ0WAF2_9BACT|nr:hypothetical protein [Niabella yanshanensis]WQD39120.1 hypothetical protein U0035_03030 [Niabella yanshanensis]
MPVKQNNKKQKEGSLFGALNPDEMISNANKVLSAAVNVLEEEIAAGILAAKKIETKIIDVDNIREDPQDLMNRIRRDVHEAVDLLMDSVTAITMQLGVLTQGTKTRPATAAKNEKQKSTEIPIIQNLKPAAAGDVVTLKLALANMESKQPVNIRLRKVDLNGPLSHTIPANHITLKPASITLNTGQEKEISIQIKVPPNILAGQYSGLFVDTQDSANKAIIHLDVI